MKGIVRIHPFDWASRAENRHVKAPAVPTEFELVTARAMGTWLYPSPATAGFSWLGAGMVPPGAVKIGALPAIKRNEYWMGNLEFAMIGPEAKSKEAPVAASADGTTIPMRMRPAGC